MILKSEEKSSVGPRAGLKKLGPARDQPGLFRAGLVSGRGEKSPARARARPRAFCIFSWFLKEFQMKQI
jgi:hypothetical protein